MTWTKFGKGLLIAFAWTVTSGLYLLFGFVIVVTLAAFFGGLFQMGLWTSLGFLLKVIFSIVLSLIAIGVILASHAFVESQVEEFFEERKRSKRDVKKEEQDG